MLARAEAQRVYGATRESQNERTRYTLKHSTCSHEWWEILNGTIFGMKPSIPALKGPGRGLVVTSAEKESLLGSQFCSKRCREQFVTSLSSFPQSRCNSLAYRIPVFLHLLLDLDTYGGVDPLGVFPLFLEMVTEIIAPKLSIILGELIRRGSFPECWRSAKVTAIPKGALSPDWENNRPISITHILSKVYEKLVSHTLSSFCDNFFLPAAQFVYRIGLGCTDALRTISHALQKSLDTGMESNIVQLDFCAAIDRVSYSGLLFKLKSIGVGGSVLSICRELFPNRRQRFVVNGATSESIPIVSGVPQGSVLGPLLFILYSSEMIELVENRLYPYADDFTLLAVAASQQTDQLLLPPLTGLYCDLGVVQPLVHATES